MPMITGETVEKVHRQILGGDAEKNDFTECATINNLTIMKGRETPKNQALIILTGFSTVSEVLFDPITALKFQKITREEGRLREGKSGFLLRINPLVI